MGWGGVGWGGAWVHGWYGVVWVRCGVWCGVMWHSAVRCGAVCCLAFLAWPCSSLCPSSSPPCSSSSPPSAPASPSLLSVALLFAVLLLAVLLLAVRLAVPACGGSEKCEGRRLITLSVVSGNIMFNSGVPTVSLGMHACTRTHAGLTHTHTTHNTYTHLLSHSHTCAHNELIASPI